MKLKSGGFLFKENYNSQTQKYQLTDVTSDTPCYLHEFVELENVSVRDIYKLVAKHKSLQDILKHNFIQEFLAHIEKHPQSTAKVDPENPQASIEFIEIYRTAYYDEELNRLEFDNIPSVHGLSHVLIKEHEGFKPGSRINWSLSFTPITDIIDIPIKTLALVHTQQDNHLNHYNFSNPLKFERHRYTLFEIISAITWELSFHGSPEETQEAGEELKEIADEVHHLMEEIEEGNIEPNEVFTSIDDLFPRDEFISGFSFISEDINKKELNTLLHYLPNKVDVVMFCSIAFKGKLTLKPEYAGLSAYEYRHSMLKGDSDLILSNEMREIINKKQGLRSSNQVVAENAFYDILSNLGGSITPEQLQDIETS